jgi:hypothetical protein
MVIVEKGAGSELVRDINFSLPASKAGRVFIGVVFSQQIPDRFFFQHTKESNAALYIVEIWSMRKK